MDKYLSPIWQKYLTFVISRSNIKAINKLAKPKDGGSMNKTKIMSIRVDEQEDEILAKKSNEIGLGKAATVRLIIREWAEMRKNFVTVPIKGAVVEGGKITIEEELARR